MSDVRLTATNPEDSSVVPVACNSKGELLLEAPIAPPEFDGNLDGDLNADGSATFAGVCTVGDRVVCNKDGANSNTQASFISYQEDGATAGVSFTAGGAASFSGNVRVNNSSGDAQAYLQNDGSLNVAWGQLSSGLSTYVSGPTGRYYIGFDGIDHGMIVLNPSDGSGTFTGDVIVGSRGKEWLIRESNGVAMLVEQTRRGAKEPRIKEKVRDLPRELDLIEAALGEVMEKLEMTPPSGWPVWDGSDNSQ